jgi:hypothetical protein
MRVIAMLIRLVSYCTVNRQHFFFRPGVPFALKRCPAAANRLSVKNYQAIIYEMSRRQCCIIRTIGSLFNIVVSLPCTVVLVATGGYGCTLVF